MGRPSKFTADDIRTIAAMRRQGASWRAIGATVGRANQLCRQIWVECLGHPGGWARPRGTKATVEEIATVAARRHRGRRNAHPLSAGSTISRDAIALPGIEALTQ